jgi:hypothetical protein
MAGSLRFARALTVSTEYADFRTAATSRNGPITRLAAAGGAKSFAVAGGSRWYIELKPKRRLPVGRSKPPLRTWSPPRSPNGAIANAHRGKAYLVFACDWTAPPARAQGCFDAQSSRKQMAHLIGGRGRSCGAVLCACNRSNDHCHRSFRDWLSARPKVRPMIQQSMQQRQPKSALQDGVIITPSSFGVRLSSRGLQPVREVPQQV